MAYQDLREFLGARPEAPRTDDVDFSFMPVADKIAPHLMNVAVQREAHAVLLQVAEELHGLH